MADLRNSNKRKSTHASLQENKKTRKSDFSSRNSASVQAELGPFIIAAVQSTMRTSLKVSGKILQNFKNAQKNVYFDSKTHLK